LKPEHKAEGMFSSALPLVLVNGKPYKSTPRWEKHILPTRTQVPFGGADKKKHILHSGRENLRAPHAKAQKHKNIPGF
jgi:hypothetical protein